MVVESSRSEVVTDEVDVQYKTEQTVRPSKAKAKSAKESKRTNSKTLTYKNYTISPPQHVVATSKDNEDQFSSPRVLATSNDIAPFLMVAMVATFVTPIILSLMYKSWQDERLRKSGEVVDYQTDRYRSYPRDFWGRRIFTNKEKQGEDYKRKLTVQNEYYERQDALLEEQKQQREQEEEEQEEQEQQEQRALFVERLARIKKETAERAASLKKRAALKAAEAQKRQDAEQRAAKMRRKEKLEKQRKAAAKVAKEKAEKEQSAPPTPALQKQKKTDEQKKADMIAIKVASKKSITTIETEQSNTEQLSHGLLASDILQLEAEFSDAYVFIDPESGQPNTIFGDLGIKMINDKTCSEKTLEIFLSLWEHYGITKSNGEYVLDTERMMNGPLPLGMYASLLDIPFGIANLASLADIDNDGEITFVEFVRACTLCYLAEYEEKHFINNPNNEYRDDVSMDIIYRTLDLNNDGKISKKELGIFVRRLEMLSYFLEGDEYTTVESLMASFDVNKDGFISKEEFMEMCSYIDFSSVTKHYWK